jgi:hypothetical protein
MKKLLCLTFLLPLLSAAQTADTKDGQPQKENRVSRDFEVLIARDLNKTIDPEGKMECCDQSLRPKDILEIRHRHFFVAFYGPTEPLEISRIYRGVYH